MTFMDGNRITPGTAQCKCGPECEFPCWQRLGLTSDPCCAGCAPLPSTTDPEETADGFLAP